MYRSTFININSRSQRLIIHWPITIKDSGALCSRSLVKNKMDQLSSHCFLLFVFIPPAVPPLHVLYLHHVPLHLVTMQIYLIPLSRKTGRTDPGMGVTTLQPNTCSRASGPAADGAPDEKNTAFTVLLRNKPCESPLSPLKITGYKNPIKTPNQYFQICY